MIGGGSYKEVLLDVVSLGDALLGTLVLTDVVQHYSVPLHRQTKYYSEPLSTHRQTDTALYTR